MPDPGRDDEYTAAVPLGGQLPCSRVAVGRGPADAEDFGGAWDGKERGEFVAARGGHDAFLVRVGGAMGLVTPYASARCTMRVASRVGRPLVSPALTSQAVTWVSVRPDQASSPPTW